MMDLTLLDGNGDGIADGNIADRGFKERGRSYGIDDSLRLSTAWIEQSFEGPNQTEE